MNVVIEKQEKYTLLRINDSKLNSLNATNLKAHFEKIFEDHSVHNVILDMSHVAYVDSSGLSAVLTGNRFAKNANGTFVMACINDTVDKIVKISKLDNVLYITPTVSEAVDTIFMEEIERDLLNAEGGEKE